MSHLNFSVLLHNHGGCGTSGVAAASSSFADWVGAPSLHVPTGVQKPFGGLGGSNLFAPTGAPEVRSRDKGISKRESSSEGVSDWTFDAAIGPLWLQTLETCSGHANAGVADSGSAGTCERRIVLNCEVATIDAAPAHSAFKVTLGLSNGEIVTSSKPLFRTIGSFR